MQWELTNDRPLYIQLTEQLKRLILSGEYAPGDPFPSVRELASSANVNPNTMQRALSELEREGLLITERTAGRRITSDHSMLDAMRSELALAHLKKLRSELTSLVFEPEKQLDFIQKAWDKD